MSKLKNELSRNLSDLHRWELGLQLWDQLEDQLYYGIYIQVRDQIYNDLYLEDSQ